jgi:hypothetical protein
MRGLKRLRDNRLGIGQTAGPSTPLRSGRDDKVGVSSLVENNCPRNTINPYLVIPRVCDLIAFLKISTLKPINLQLDIV